MFLFIVGIIILVSISNFFTQLLVAPFMLKVQREMAEKEYNSSIFSCLYALGLILLIMISLSYSIAFLYQITLG